MDQWYYYQDGQRLGPVTRAELREMFESGALPPDTQVWARGMESWTPATDAEGLLRQPTATVEQGGISEDMDLPPGLGFVPSGEQVRPWVRYWAKMMDMYLFSLFTGLVVGLAWPGVFLVPDLLFGILLMILYCFVDPLLLSSWGTTPGRSILRVQVRSREGGKLPYGAGLARSFLVFLKGLGLGLPIVSLITMIVAYNTLSREGVTSWDESVGAAVTHQSIGGLRIALYVVILAIMVGFFLWSATLAGY